MSQPQSDQPATTDDVPALRGLCGKFILAPDAHELVELLAADLAVIAHERCRDSGVFHLALSGGSTPQLLYKLLMIDPRYRQFPWRATRLWIVDDRCVDFEDDRSNYKMIRELLADHSGIPAEQVYPMPVLEGDGAERYERDLRAALGDGPSDGRLDFVLLGMGGDAHTASLFPRTPALSQRHRWVVFNDGDTVASPRPRMTMTYPLINAARRIAVLVTGQSKHATLVKVAESLQAGRCDVQDHPIAGVTPEHKDAEMAWYLDHPAAFGT